MAETPNQSACASLHGFALERELPLGATVEVEMIVQVD